MVGFGESQVQHLACRKSVSIQSAFGSNIRPGGLFKHDAAE